jgi:hypothetical protein
LALLVQSGDEMLFNPRYLVAGLVILSMALAREAQASGEGGSKQRGVRFKLTRAGIAVRGARQFQGTVCGGPDLGRVMFDLPGMGRKGVEVKKVGARAQVTLRHIMTVADLPSFARQMRQPGAALRYIAATGLFRDPLSIFAVSEALKYAVDPRHSADPRAEVNGAEVGLVGPELHVIRTWRPALRATAQRRANRALRYLGESSLSEKAAALPLSLRIPEQGDIELRSGIGGLRESPESHTWSSFRSGWGTIRVGLFGGVHASVDFSPQGGVEASLYVERVEDSPGRVRLRFQSQRSLTSLQGAAGAEWAQGIPFIPEALRAELSQAVREIASGEEVMLRVGPYSVMLGEEAHQPVYVRHTLEESAARAESVVNDMFASQFDRVRAWAREQITAN